MKTQINNAHHTLLERAKIARGFMAILDLKVKDIATKAGYTPTSVTMGLNDKDGRLTAAFMDAIDEALCDFHDVLTENPHTCKAITTRMRIARPSERKKELEQKKNNVTE